MARSGRHRREGRARTHAPARAGAQALAPGNPEHRDESRLERWNAVCKGTRFMTMTLGQLVSELFEVFERRYGDRDLAARATQTIVNDLLCKEKERAAQRTPRVRTIAPTDVRRRSQPLRRAA